MHFQEYGLLDAIPSSLIDRCNIAEKMAVSIFITEERDVRERRIQTHLQKQEDRSKSRYCGRTNASTWLYFLHSLLLLSLH